jgi:hypothetical protein
MKRLAIIRAVIFSIVSTLAVCTVCEAQIQSQNTLQALVNNYFPEALAKNANLTGGLDGRQYSCFAVYDYLPNQSAKTIVVGYSNGALGDILVLQSADGRTYSASYEVTGLDLTGIECSVNLFDVNGDGRNEVLVSFASARENDMDWLFTWDGQKLSLLGPTLATGMGDVFTSLMNTAVVDLFHDGTLQLISMGEYPPQTTPTVADSIYYLHNGVFTVLPNPALFNADFEMGTFAIESLAFGFANVEGSQGPYSLKIVNGDRSGQHRFHAATINLNSKVIVQPTQLNDSVEFLSVPITVLSKNDLRVSFQGNTGDLATIVVVATNPDPSGDGKTDCTDLGIVKASIGKKIGQSGFDPRADINSDGVVNVLDLSTVAKQLPAGTVCH